MTNVVDFYVFWGEESDNGISFHPSGIDFAVYDMTIFPNDGKWHVTAQQNL